MAEVGIIVQHAASASVTIQLPKDVLDDIQKSPAPKTEILWRLGDK